MNERQKANGKRQTANGGVARSLLSTLLAGLCLGIATAALASDLVSENQVERTVGLRHLDIRDGAVTGEVVNESPVIVRDVRLLVRHIWYWKDERHPGEGSPGRSNYVAIDGDIPPGGSRSFSYTPVPPLPIRDDGHFETQVEVVGFVQAGG